MARMTKESLAEAVKESEGWDKPEYNDVLYLQCKGFSKITEAIFPYSSCKALWLQQNALGKVENLEQMPELGCLFLHQNCITRMSGFQHLAQLTTLNLSNNYITKIENLGGLPVLETLQLSHNRLETLESLQGLSECPTIATLDISHNALSADKEKGEKAEDLITVLQQVPALKCLYVQGNEITGQTRYWRRKVIVGVKQLTYMDERPVFEEERRAVDAWGIGGFEAEQAARDEMRAEKRQKEKAAMQKWKDMQEAGRAKKEVQERELAKREEERAKWRAGLALDHCRERRECENEFMEARAETWHEEKREHASRVAAEAAERAAALQRQQRREEKAVAEREAAEEIEREERQQSERRAAYLAEMQTQQLSLQQEMEFLERETALLSEREAARDAAAQEEIDQLVVKGPPPELEKTEKGPRHADPGAAPDDAAAAYVRRAVRSAQPSARTTAIWEQYAKWDSRRGQRKARPPAELPRLD